MKYLTEIQVLTTRAYKTVLIVLWRRNYERDHTINNLHINELLFIM